MLDVFVALRKWLRKRRLRNQAAATAVVAPAVSGNCGEACDGSSCAAAVALATAVVAGAAAQAKRLYVVWIQRRAVVEAARNSMAS